MLKLVSEILSKTLKSPLPIFFFPVALIESKALYMLDKYSATMLHPQSQNKF